MVIRLLEREEYIDSMTNHKEDNFQLKFLGKADLQNLWGEHAYGAFDNGKLAGGIIYKISKRKPLTVNLSLLHTFYESRGKGVGKILTEYCFQQSYQQGVEYFRVSADPGSKSFYEKLGFQFWGQQKRGCSLCVCKMTSPFIKDAIYDITDDYIYQKVYLLPGRIYEG